MTSNARRYKMSHKQNDFLSVQTTVGTIIYRPSIRYSNGSSRMPTPTNRYCK